MNAVVALCHFCEVHGPRIVFCCQPFHDEHEQPSSAMTDDVTVDDDDVTLSTGGRQRRRLPPIFYGKYDEYFDVASETSLEQAKSNDTCNACRSMKSTKPGFLSNDHENRISYVGSQFPYHPEVFTIVRQACVRSLSCEVCPGREGPIFFGNEQYGYCLCYPFILKDSKARGFQRWYSYCIVSMDKLLLLNFYDLLTGALKLLVDFLQRLARGVFDNEQSSRHGGENLPQIAASGRLGWLPSGFMRERAGSSSSGVARSLVELSGDGEIFSKLQRYFVWVLRLPSQYVVEQVLEGLPTQDELVRLELLEDRGFGFVEEDKNGFMENVKNDQTIVNGHDDSDGAKEMTDHFESSNQEVLDLQNVAHLRQLFHIFGSEAFRILAYHVVVGNQVVVKSESIDLTEMVLDALKFILPLGCCHVIYCSDLYVEPWRCNLLGLTQSGSLPETFTPACGGGGANVAAGDDQLVLVSAKIVDRPTSSDNNDDVIADRSMKKSINLDRCSFRLNYLGGPPEEFPTILDRLTLILSSDSNVSNQSVHKCLTVLKEEWLNKSKLLFQLTKGHVMFAASVLDHQQDNRYTETFRKVAKCTKLIDELVVKFWQAGLSKQYKTFVLNKVLNNNHQQNGSGKNTKTVNSTNGSRDSSRRNSQPKL